MTRVTPKERYVTTTRVIEDTGRIVDGEPMLAHRTKTVYFTPRHVVIQIRQERDGTMLATRVVVKGWDRANKPRMAFFNPPTGMLLAPPWLQDYMGKLCEEIAEKYGPDS